MPRIFNADGTFEDVEHINWYLLAGPDIYAESRTTPLCPVPRMTKGSQPTDDGNLIIEADEYEDFLKREPRAEKYIRPLLGSREFIHNEKRYCLWLVDATPDEIKKNKFIYERVKKVQEFRLKSSSAKTRKDAEIPYLFQKIIQPNEDYLFIPQVSSEKRKYIPIDFLSSEIISLDPNFIIPNAEIWHFGILTSSVHMAWTKTVCGRLKSDYRYSAKIVYNNFVWMKMKFIDYAELILAAKKILDVRKNYPDASLADLYDEVTMPKDLRDAHKKVDKIVMKIYNFDESMTETEIAIKLLMMYDELRNFLSMK